MPFSASFRHICCLALIGSAKSEFLGGVDDVVADEGAGERGAADRRLLAGEEGVEVVEDARVSPAMGVTLLDGGDVDQLPRASAGGGGAISETVKDCPSMRPSISPFVPTSLIVRSGAAAPPVTVNVPVAPSAKETRTDWWSTILRPVR